MIYILIDKTVLFRVSALHFVQQAKGPKQTDQFQILGHHLYLHSTYMQMPQAWVWATRSLLLYFYLSICDLNSYVNQTYANTS